MIDLNIDGSIATISLCRPPVNAINDAWVARFDEVLDDIAAAEDVAVVWLRSTQKVFCAGADLAEMRANLADPDRVDDQIAAVRDIQNVLKRIETLPMSTVAEVGGAAMGGGLELALACDLRIVAAEARIGLPEVTLGLIPGAGGTQRLTALCGPAVAKRLILGGEIVDGSTAAELGLAHWAVPRAELAAFAAITADRLAKLPRAAVAEAKACIALQGDPTRDGYEEELSATRRLLLHEPETRARVEAFLAGQR